MMNVKNSHFILYLTDITQYIVFHINESNDFDQCEKKFNDTKGRKIEIIMIYTKDFAILGNYPSLMI